VRGKIHAKKSTTRRGEGKTIARRVKWGGIRRGGKKKTYEMVEPGENFLFN